MDSARPKNAKNLLPLRQAAQRLGVSVEVLLNLNEYNILKPTITLTGEIGYTEEQINNFLVIQKLSGQGQKAIPEKDLQKFDGLSLTPSFETSKNLERITISSKIASLLAEKKRLLGKTPASSQPKAGKLRSFLAITSLSFIFFLLIFALHTQQANSRDTGMYSYQKDNAVAEPGSKLSELTPSESPTTSAASSIKLKNSSEQNSKLSDEGLMVTDEKLAVQKEMLVSKSSSAASINNTEQIPDVREPDEINESSGGTTLTNLTSFASGPSCPSCFKNEDIVKDSIFDNDGNIKGQPSGVGLLAVTALRNVDMDHVGASTQAPNPLMLISFLAVGALSGFFILRHQYAFSGAGSAGIYIAPVSSLGSQNIFEVNQKTDGTVVFYFKGAEYKVSKPELDSESDQFISRLMDLVQQDVKEVDYDSLSDEKVRFNAPLSKLVTRLGFVGIKRDLFFPRTSKNRVHFRRYVTKDDLIAMSLTEEQISIQL